MPEVSFGALMSFYINLVCFPILFEVALQTVFLFFGIGYALFSSRRDVSNLRLFENMGSVEKVGVKPDPKRAGPASWNLEHA